MNAASFTWSVTGYNSSVLATALSRYQKIIAASTILSVAPANCTTVSGSLTGLSINVQSQSLALDLNTSEKYSLTIPANGGVGSLTADTVYGAMRGLETFSQLLDWIPAQSAWVLPAPATVIDAPALQHRGGMIDTARHFLPLNAILAFVDALAYNKMNVLHWVSKRH